jgi:twitching motility protein PilT
VNLLDSLLDAIVRLNGDALVMHVGEKPYVVTTSEATNEFRGPLAWGQVELSTRVLTPEAVAGMLGQILPIDQRVALDEYGATEYEVTAATDATERFTIVAARGGDDIWLEVRRLSRQQPEPLIAAPVAEPELVGVAAGDEQAGFASSPSDAGLYDAQRDLERHEGANQFDLRNDDLSEAVVDSDDDVLFDGTALGGVADAIAADPDWGDDVMTEGDLGELLRASASAIILGEAGEVDQVPAPADARQQVDELVAPVAAGPIADGQTGPRSTADFSGIEAATDFEVPTPALEAVKAAHEAIAATAEITLVQPEPFTAEETGRELPEPAPAESSAAQAPPAAPEITAISHESISPLTDGRAEERFEPPQEMTRGGEMPAANTEDAPMFEDVAAEERSMTDDSRSDLSVPVFSRSLADEAAESGTAAGSPAAADQDDREELRSRPAAVVVPLTRPGRGDAATEARGSVAAVLQRLLGLAAARGAATVYIVAQSAPMVRVDGEFSVLDGEPTLSTAFVDRMLAELTPQGRDAASPAAEWIADVAEIGRVRCVTFRDHRGPGIIFRMIPARAIAAEQLGLPSEVQALCTEADGLILVAGGRGSGRSTLLTSFVDLINRHRSDHVITTESQIEFVHENKRSFISQREVRGNGDALAATVRSAIREEPDVLFIEDIRTPELAALALDAAESGRLVFGAVPAVSTVSAVERLLEMFPPERREKAQASLAATLRGVVSQVLLRRLKGGRVAAREVLINTPAIAALILQGRTGQLPEALENGRRHGMIPFAESLAALVREGTVHPAHAQRKAPDREQLLAVLRRDGGDAASVERLA